MYPPQSVTVEYIKLERTPGIDTWDHTDAHHGLIQTELQRFLFDRQAHGKSSFLQKAAKPSLQVQVDT